MNLVLIGYRGTGKTVVGQRLAEDLGLRYVGLDDAIVQRAGKPIPEIVEDAGWDGFRDVESDVVRAASVEDGCVLDTGGGAILRDSNVAALRHNGMVFWLQASVDDIVARIGGDDQRPSLTGKQSFTDEVAEVLAERTPKYAAAADVVVDTSGLSLDEVVAAISEAFRRPAKRRGLGEMGWGGLGENGED